MNPGEGALDRIGCVRGKQSIDSEDRGRETQARKRKRAAVVDDDDDGDDRQFRPLLACLVVRAPSFGSNRLTAPPFTHAHTPHSQVNDMAGSRLAALAGGIDRCGRRRAWHGRGSGQRNQRRLAALALPPLERNEPIGAATSQPPSSSPSHAHTTTTHNNINREQQQDRMALAPPVLGVIIWTILCGAIIVLINVAKLGRFIDKDNAGWVCMYVCMCAR